MKCNFQYALENDEKIYCMLKTGFYNVCDEEECIFMQILKKEGDIE